MEDNLNSSSVNKQISKIDKEINTLEGKKNKLVDMRLGDSIDKATYEARYADLVVTQENLIEDRKKLVETSENEKDIKRRLKEFKKTLEQNEVLDEFNRYVLESVVEKVAIGGIEEDGNKDPAQITFVYKTGFKNSLNGDKFRPQRKNAKGRHRTDELCSHDNNEVKNLCSDSSTDTYRGEENDGILRLKFEEMLEKKIKEEIKDIESDDIHSPRILEYKEYLEASLVEHIKRNYLK